MLTPIFLINNTVRYLGRLMMNPVPPGAQAPDLTHEEFNRLVPYAQQIVDRLGRNEPLHEVAGSVAASSVPTSGQVVLFIHVMMRQ